MRFKILVLRALIYIIERIGGKGYDKGEKLVSDMEECIEDLKSDV